MSSGQILAGMETFSKCGEQLEQMEPLFIKGEPEWSASDEEPSNMGSTSEEPVQIKVEPDLLFPEQTLEEEDGQESQEEPSGDEGEERDNALNDFRTSPEEQASEMGKGSEETILPNDENISRNWNCIVCGETFQEELNLKNHLLCHKEFQTPSMGGLDLSCDRCDKTLTNKQEFNDHVSSHKGSKANECSICGKMFSKKSNLYRHLVGHTGERSYSCSTCGRSFTRRSNLERHMLTHTGHRQYPCSTCGKFFLQRSHLKTHILTHKNERPYVCNTCPKTFICLSHLKTHMSTHTGQRRHSCAECGKAFFHLSNLRAHVLTHLKKQATSSSMC